MSLHPSPQSKPPALGPIARIVRAAGYSWAGLRAAWTHEASFRQESILAAVLMPLSFWVGQTWIERSVLFGVVALVLLTELLNSSIEAIVDKASPEPHPLAKQAKDIGSAAVFVSLVTCSVTWMLAVLSRWCF